VGNKESVFISFLHASIKGCYHHDFHKLERVLLNYAQRCSCNRIVAG